MQYLRYDAGEVSGFEGPVITETSLTIFINKTELATLQCTPTKLNCLVVGFLFNEGIISSLDDIAMLRVCEDDRTADIQISKAFRVDQVRRTLTSGCGGGVSLLKDENVKPVESETDLSVDQVFTLVRKLYERAELHRESGGVHTSALGDGDQLLFVSEDIGRHNTIDKLAGESILRFTSIADKVLVTTGRISSDMLLKAARMRVPIVVSRTSPTSMAVELARELNITVVGYVRGKSLNVYSGEHRITGFVQKTVAKATV